MHCSLYYHAGDVHVLPAVREEPRVRDEAAKLDEPVDGVLARARGGERHAQRLVQRVARAQRLRRGDAHHLIAHRTAPGSTAQHSTAPRRAARAKTRKDGRTGRVA